jgi:hypothetical protein
MNQHPIPRSWYRGIAGFLLLLVVNHFAADWITRHTASSKVHWLIEQEPVATDCVVLGSSAALASIDPALLAKELGIDVLMLAEEGAAYPEQELIWELFLERRRSKYLLLEVDPWGVTNLGYSWPFHEYNYLPFLNHPRIEAAVTEQKGSWQTAAWKYVPMLKFAQFNSQFGVVQFGSWLKGTRYDPRASGMNHQVSTAEQMAKHSETDLFVGWQWDESRIKALNQILDLAEKQGTRAILYYTPIFSGCHFSEEEKIVVFYRKLAAEKNVPLLVIDDEKIVGQHGNFKDPTHLDAVGAKLFTQAIAEQIKAAKLIEK